MIVINALHKSYGSNKILNNINLTFKKGEVNGIIGENGAGKTTLFRCITGLENYTGTITYNQGILKNVTGFLPTNPYFLSRITGQEYLQLMCNAREIKINDFNERDIFNLPLKQFASTYSTGMKKKLALLALLLQNNDIYILDEPFNGIDIQSNILIMEIIAKLKELGKIVILSSHIFSTLNESCDLLHHLKAGKIYHSVSKDEFNAIENEIKSSTLHQQIDKLQLR